MLDGTLDEEDEELVPMVPETVVTGEEVVTVVFVDELTVPYLIKDRLAENLDVSGTNHVTERATRTTINRYRPSVARRRKRPPPGVAHVPGTVSDRFPSPNANRGVVSFISIVKYFST